MTSLAVRRALETGLAAIDPPIDTAYENAPFTPTQGAPYQQVTVMFAEPDDAEMGNSWHFEQGLMQAGLFYPLGAGPEDAQQRAELIRQTFYRGATFTESGVTVTVRRTPTIAQAVTLPDRFLVPVRIPFSAQVPRS